MDEKDIERKDFTVSLRGYDREEVDAYLAELAREIRALKTDRSEPPAPSAPPTAAATFQQIGEETSRILVVADEAGREIRARAEREAASVVAEARTRAEEMSRKQQEELRALEDHIRRLKDARDTLATQLEDVSRRLQETLSRVRAPMDVIGGRPTKAPPAPKPDRPQTHVPPMERERPAPPQRPSPARPEVKAPPPPPVKEEPRAAPLPEKEAPRPAPPVKEAPPRPAPEKPPEPARPEPSPPARPPAPKGKAVEAPPRVQPAPSAAPVKTETPPETKPAEPPPSAAVVEAEPEVAPPAPDKPTDAATASATAALEQLLEEVRRDREQGQREVQAALGEITKEAPPEAKPAPTPVEVDADALLSSRDDVIGDATSSAARRLKRLLQEDQNYLLDRLRTHRGKGSFDESIAPSDVQLERFQEGMNEVLEESFLAGRQTAGLTDTSDAGRPVADLISKQIVTPLRRDLGRIIDSGLAAGDTVKAIAERASDVFRVWKGIRSELLGEGLVYSAYHQGLVDAWRRGSVGQKVWVRSPSEEDCPRGVCDKNADAGAVELNATFPSGHLTPPAHGGCTCVLTSG
jgi:DivIVA domain-containing protein